MNSGRKANPPTNSVRNVPNNVIRETNSNSFDEDIKPEPDCTLNEGDPDVFRPNPGSDEHDPETSLNQRYPKRNRVSRSVI